MSLEKKDVLPDSRARETKGRIFTSLGTWIPIFCANCGVEGGACPAENMTFICWLCPKCSETWTPLANTWVMPDELFFQRLKDEQMASYGRYLTDVELAAVVEAGDSPLAKLIKAGR